MQQNNKAVYWSTSAQSSKTFEYFLVGRKIAAQDDLCSHTKHVIICFLLVCWLVHSFCQAVHKCKSNIPDRVSLPWSWHIFLDWPLTTLLCYTVGFNSCFAIYLLIPLLFLKTADMSLLSCFKALNINHPLKAHKSVLMKEQRYYTNSFD